MRNLPTIISSFRKILRRKSIQHLGFIYSGRMASAVLRFVASVAVARALGAERLGVLTIAAVIMGLSGRLLEMGLTTTMVRKLAFFISANDDEKAVGIFKRIYFLRLQVSSVFVVLAYFLAPIVAEKLYHSAALTGPLRLAALGAFAFNVWEHSDGTLRALERFKQIAIINTCTQFVRASLILLFAYSAILNVENTMMINIGEIIIAYTVASLFIPRRFYSTRVYERYPLRDIFSYSGWIFLFSIIFMLFDRLDVLMLGYFKAETEVGLYAVAFTLIRPFELIPETFNTVFLPKVAKYTKKLQVFRYMRDTLKVTSFVGLLGVILIFVANPLILTLYGDQYAESVKLFQVLVGAFILLTILHPFSLISHSLNKPQILVAMAGINLTLNFVGNLIFIPPYGALGAAVVTLVSRVLGALLGLLILKYYIERWDEGASAGNNGETGA
jgi:O-antigen/teichoic acid export membrane protein